MFDLMHVIDGCKQVLVDQLPVQLINYSHLPTIILGVFVSLFFLFNKNKKTNISFLVLFIFLFTIRTYANYVTWMYLYNGPLTMYFWYLLEILEVSFFFALLWFFVKSLDIKIGLLSKIVTFIPVVVVFGYYLIFGNLFEYDNVWCEATENGTLINYIVFPADIFYVLLITFFYIKSLMKKFDLKNLTLYLSILLFSIVYIWGVYFPIYSDNYNWDLISQASLPILIALISFLAVRFKFADIKILGVQVLVFFLVLLLGSQFTYITDNTNKILNTVAIIVSLLIGYQLIRSVKRVDHQRELLAEANEEQETLIHFISHQVKGFFTKSRNIFSTLADEKDISPDLMMLIEEGLRSDKEGVEMVGNILNAANLKTGKMEYKHSDIELVSMIEKIVENTRKQAEDKGLKLNYFHNGISKLDFKGDEERLRDVFANLVQNSVNYTFDGGVNVGLEKKDGQIVFTVKDTGVGLTADDKKKLFKSGGRGKDSLKYNANSTGYGLYIAKKVAKAHGGNIAAESEGRDKGSKFIVTLPLK